MNIRDVEALIAEAVGDADLRPEEIPSIDLYLDQITSLVAEKRKEGTEHFHDRVLTKTMINNYSKDGLLSPIKGKKYTKEHILQMLLVYELKNTLSIGEIKRILQSISHLPNYDPAMLERTYGKYLEIKDFERSEAWSLLRFFIHRTGLHVNNDADFLTLLLGMASISSYLKNAVQVLLDARYPELSEEKDSSKKAEAKPARKGKREGEREVEA